MGALVVVFIVVPLVELWTLVRVARAIGAVPALVILAAVSIAGAALVKRQGIAVLARIRTELANRRPPTEHLADGALLLGAGVLLTVPGFVTDAIGLALLVPPVRRGVAARLRRRWARRGRTVTTATYHGTIVDAGTAEPDDRRPPPPQELPRP